MGGSTSSILHPVTTPHPWINVIANPEFGFLVSEAGSGPSWAVNSGENRLTPWRNDQLAMGPVKPLSAG
jgi:cyclic beta-1,2-glucan synthetase